jgi:hypothetical protein
MQPEARRLLAASLLVPCKGWPWEWSTDGDAVVWQDGSTIVMREELAVLIERLAPSGVPQIGPLMLLLAGCRGKGIEETVVVQLLRGNPDGKAAPLVACRQLSELAAMPRELLSGVPAKTSLVSLVLADAPKLQPRETDAILELLLEGSPSSAWPIVRKQYHPRDFTTELRVLHDGLAHLDAGKIAHALRTGVPEPPAAAEVEIPLGERVAALLRQLENDPDYPGLAGLARDVMAAVTLPRALPQPDHDSPGGFADIGNRGQLHRLLLSELAHDDDTLAARIALGEALYLRREPAAIPPPATLALLIDAGLRMWGVPRIFGAAVALACLAKAPATQSAVAFRAHGELAEPVTLDTKEGLSAHLAALDTTLNPAAAIAAVAANLGPADGQLDIIVITHPLALHDLEFNAACSAQRGAGIRAATVDREGAFALHLRTPGGWQPLAEARLNLEALFATPSRQSSFGDSILPAMLRYEKSVFMLPIAGNLRAKCEVRRKGRPDDAGDRGAAPLTKTKYVGITDDGSMWYWDEPKKHGARRCHAVRLSGSFCDLLYDDATGCAIAVSHETRNNRVYLIRQFHCAAIAETHAAELPVPMSRPIRIWARGGHLFLGMERGVRVVNIATGEVVAEAPLLSGMSWLSDRYVARDVPDSRLFMAVTFDGTQVTFQGLMPKWLRQNSRSVLRLFERDGIEGLWALDNQGRFFDVESGIMKIDANLGAISEARESRDGHVFWLRNFRGTCKNVYLNELRMTPSFEGDAAFESAPAPRAWTLRNKFSHVGLSLSGRVCLRAQKGYWVEIQQREMCRTFAIEERRADSEPQISVAFGQPQKLPDHGCALSLAKLPGAGCAWLDSRGLMHLRSGDLSIPELTIVLAESTSLPVWASDETSVGPAYFVSSERQGREDLEKLAGYIRSFVASCR